MSSSQTIQGWLILIPIAYLIWFFWRIRSNRIETREAGNSMQIPMKAQLYIAGVALAAGILLVVGFANRATLDPVRFAVCVAVSY